MSHSYTILYKIIASFWGFSSTYHFLFSYYHWQLTSFLSHILQFTEVAFTMQLLTGAEHFGNVIFRYSELPSQYHIDASIDVNRPRQDCDITCGLQQIELLVRVPFLLQSPEEENKKNLNGA